MRRLSSNQPSAPWSAPARLQRLTHCLRAMVRRSPMHELVENPHSPATFKYRTQYSTCLVVGSRCFVVYKFHLQSRRFRLIIRRYALQKAVYNRGVITRCNNNNSVRRVSPSQLNSFENFAFRCDSPIFRRGLLIECLCRQLEIEIHILLLSDSPKHITSLLGICRDFLCHGNSPRTHCHHDSHVNMSFLRPTF